jgi:hypothetical protein
MLIRMYQIEISRNDKLLKRSNWGGPELLTLSCLGVGCVYACLCLCVSVTPYEYECLYDIVFRRCVGECLGGCWGEVNECVSG